MAEISPILGGSSSTARTAVSAWSSVATASAVQSGLRSGSGPRRPGATGLGGRCRGRRRRGGAGPVEVEADDLAGGMPVDEEPPQRVGLQGDRRPDQAGLPADVAPRAQDGELSLQGRDADRPAGEVGDGERGRAAQVIRAFVLPAEVVALDAVGEAAGEDQAAVAARREPADVGHQRFLPEDLGLESAEVPRRGEGHGGERPVGRRAEQEGPVGDEAEMGQGLPRLEPAGGTPVPVVELRQAQLGRDGDVAPVGVDRQRRGFGGPLPVDGHLEIGAEQPEPRPFAEQRDERAVVADGAGEDPARGARDGTMASAGVEQVDAVGLVPGQDRPRLAGQAQPAQRGVGQHRPGRGRGEPGSRPAGSSDIGRSCTSPRAIRPAEKWPRR